MKKSRWYQKDVIFLNHSYVLIKDDDDKGLKKIDTKKESDKKQK